MTGRYEWASRFPSNKVDPDKACARFMKLRAADGHLDPEAVVKDARRKRSPLHPLFEWDDSAAAHEYRIEQARAAIRAVVWVVEKDDGEEQSCRAFHHVAVEGQERGYYALPDVKTDPAKDVYVLSQARGDLARARKRLSEYEGADAIVQALDGVLAAVDAL